MAEIYQARDILDFTEKILDNIYHIKVSKDIDSELRIILEELNTWIQEYEVSNINEVKRILSSFAERIYTQLLKDNIKSLAFYERIISLCIEILNNTKYPIQSLNKDLEYEILCIQRILEQYKSLVEYILRYQEQVKVVVSNDTDGSVLTYRYFTDFAINGYTTKLIDTAEVLDSNTNNNLRLAVYTYLFQCGYEFIEGVTASEKFVSNLVAIQNSRLFRNREESLVAVNDAIKVLSIIQMCWFFLYCAYELLKLKMPDTDVYDKLYKLLMEFLKTYDYTLLDKILELLGQVNDIDKDNVYQKISEIAFAAQSMSKIALMNGAISNYIEFLDRIQGFINRLTTFLDKFQLNLDPIYNKIQNLLDLIPNFLESLKKKLDEWLNIDNIKFVRELKALANKVIEAINKTIETLNKIACALRQMLCIIAGFLHFNTTVIGPLKEQLKQLVKDAKELLDTMLAPLQDLVSQVNDAIKVMIYKQGEMKARKLSYKAGSAIGKVSEINWSQVFSDAVNVAFGKPSSAGGSVLSSMQSTATSYIDRVKNEVLSGLSKESAVNCSPITLPNLKIKKPNFNKSYSLTKLDDIKTDVRC